MLEKYHTKKNEDMLLKAAYYDRKNPEFVSKKQSVISEDLETNTAYIFIKKENTNTDGLIQTILNFASTIKRSYQVDVKSFVRKNLDIKTVLKILHLKIDFATCTLFSRKKEEIKEEGEKEKNKKPKLSLYLREKEYLEFDNELCIISKTIEDARNLQIMPENFLNSEILAEKIVDDFQNIENLSIKVLSKRQIEELGMGLILSVNRGSTHEPRVVVIEYLGNKDQKEKTVLVGKGITFDTGGENTKGYNMTGMKYDMSGSVIAAYSVKAAAQLKLNVNVSAIMMITDNRSDGDASLPENIYKSMSGKWVEVSDTDAEGRLVLADGLYYGAAVLKATTLIDIATLTGAITVALGRNYSGIWSTEDKLWNSFKNSANIALEKVWRMPFHKDFHKSNKSSKVADLKNWSPVSKTDCNSAAMFLKEFTESVPFIHCDVAGTADTNDIPQGVLIYTLVEFFKNKN